MGAPAPLTVAAHPPSSRSLALARVPSEPDGGAVQAQRTSGFALRFQGAGKWSGGVEDGRGT